MSSNKIVLIGGGSHCMSVLDSLLNSSCCAFEDIVIADRPENIGKEICGIKIEASDHQLAELFSRGYHYAFVTVGSIKTTTKRRELWSAARDIGYQFANIIDPSAIISPTAQLGVGVFVGKSTVINSGAIIGDMTIINTGSIIEHGCSVGPFCHIAVGSILCGGACVEHDSFIGANTTIIQEERISPFSVIPAGSLVKHSKLYLPHLFS
ncbi:MAG: hypothetical protein LUH04_09890 [Clostridium sp.]|nr:hypothetical protein [Clostridium sp.]